MKATSLELARNCQETAQDVKSLGVILKVLNVEVQGNVQSDIPELNPFQTAIIGAEDQIKTLKEQALQQRTKCDQEIKSLSKANSKL